MNKHCLWFTMAVTCLLAAGHPQQATDAQRRAAEPQWKRGLPADPGFFPIAVWLQNPAKASDYKAAGINLYVGLWQGPTTEQLSQLRAAGMPVVVEQSKSSLMFKDDPTIVAWMHNDEPDNAQEVTDPKTGRKGYGPCIPPPKIVADYEKMRAADPTRPVMLNLGQGVANDAWVGRGEGAKLEDYRTYVKGADIVSFDVYPVASNLKPGGGNNLWYVSKGLDRLKEWTGGTKQIWNCIECTRIDGEGKATPAQVRAEVWSALAHGSQGLIYFVHQFKPTFDEHALLDDPEMLRTVTATNRQIRDLAPILNSSTLPSAVTVASSSDQAPIGMMVKHHDSATYIFAVEPYNRESKGTFTLKGRGKASTAEVVGEGRTVTLTGGRFEDSFRPYDVHIYRIRD